MNFSIPRKLAPFLNKKKRYKIAIGGRGSGKSMTIADILLFWAAQQKEKILCIREYQSSIEDSCLALLEDEIIRIDIPGFNVGKTTVEHKDGGMFRFKGLARSISSIKSYHGFKKAFIEEAQFLSEESIRILKPTFRAKDSEILMAANPGSSNDPFSKRFLNPFWKQLLRDGVYEDDMHYIVMMNYNDNPFFPEILEQERQADYENLPRAEYEHIWEGKFNDSVENAIIKAEWFDECVDAHLKLKFEPIGKIIVAHDPSDSGYDDKGLIIRHGSVIIGAELSQIPDVNDGMTWALEHAVECCADHFVWDADGMGLGLKKQVRDYLEGEDIDYTPFRGSGGVAHPNKVFEDPTKHVKNKDKQKTNKQAIKNRRAQKYWDLRTRIYNTYLALKHPEYQHQPAEHLISFSSKCTEIEQLRSEVCRIPRVLNNNGLIQIMSKQDMLKKGIYSPNLADPCMMSLITPPLKLNTKPIVFQNPWRRSA